MNRKTSEYPADPPWPPPDIQNLAGGVLLPPMDEKASFVRFVLRHFPDTESFAAERWRAARRLIAGGDFRGPVLRRPYTPASHAAEPRTLAAWLLTPREAFIPGSAKTFAYRPCALSVGHGQTISAPYMVTRMTAALNPRVSDKVLEIGTGSGYQAAMLSVLCDNVRTIEYVGPLATRAGETFDDLAVHRPWIAKIRRRSGNGYRGWEDGAPYDFIIVTCAIDHPPPALLDQLSPGGLLILPLGGAGSQILAAIRRRRADEEVPPAPSWEPADGLAGGALSGGAFDVTDVYGNGKRVVFVPFVH